MTMFKNFLYVLYSRFRYANYYRAVKRGMKVGKNFLAKIVYMTRTIRG